MSGFIELYRQRALDPDPNAMNGRKLAEATRLISRNIAVALNPYSGSTIVDIGCGNGATLMAIAETSDQPFRPIGILPTEEEISRARQETNSIPEFRIGIVTATNLETGIADITICNSVLTAIPRRSYARAIAELRRVTKTNGTIFLGEIRHHSESDLSLVQRIRLKLAGNPLGSWISRNEFLSITARNGLSLVRDYEHVNMNDDLMPTPMTTRRDYIFKAV